MSVIITLEFIHKNEVTGTMGLYAFVFTHFLKINEVLKYFIENIY